MQRVLDGDDAAAAELRARYEGKLIAVLCSRGAARSEAEELVADLWADCFTSRGGDRSLLAKYQGRSSFESWLTTVGMHRLVDLKRRQTFRVAVADSEGSIDSLVDRTPHTDASLTEEPLLDLLRSAIRRAFGDSDGEDVLMLKLVHLHQLTQREVGRMWGWHESKVSRTLERARGEIAETMMREVKRNDPWLELRWEDFVELCERSGDVVSRPAEDNSQAPRVRQSNLQNQDAIR